MKTVTNKLLADLRETPRVPEQADVTIKVESAPEVRKLEGRVFPSSSNDISLNGIQLLVDIPVPVGARLKLKVILENSSKSYWHKGTVVWDKTPEKDSGTKSTHTIGIKLDITNNPHAYSWRQVVNELINNNKPH